MLNRRGSYTRYSIACAVVWAIILLIVGTTAKKDTFHTFLVVFAGWAIGWTSATIARSVYPPPKQQRAQL
jgi:hypothetical protein